MLCCKKEKKSVLEYAVYQQYRHCDVFAYKSLCLAISYHTA